MYMSKINTIKEIKNKTKKKRDKMMKDIQSLTPTQREIVCKNSANTYSTFEDKVEKLFKEQKIDIVSTGFNLEKQIVEQLKQAVNTKGVQPNQDFYSYINDRWISNYELTEKQKYIIEVDDFRIVQDKVYRELIEIIEEYIKQNPQKRLTKCVQTAYKSFQSYNTQEQTRRQAKKILEYIDDLIQNKANIWTKLGELNKNEIISGGSPFVWSLNPDDKNPAVYKCYLDPPEVTLIDVDVYFDYDDDTEADKKYKTNYRKKYFDYLHTLFEIAFGADHSFRVKDIYDTEVELLNAMSCNLIKEKDMDPNGYNVVTKEEAIRMFGFDWEAFCRAMGFHTVPSEFVTSDVNYLLCGTKLLLEKWNTPQWRTYWIYVYIRQQCRFNKAGFQNFFEFHGAFVRGQQQKVDETIRPIFPMGFCFNTFLTNEYIRRYKNEQAIQYVKTMAEDLKTVFIRIIKRNTWMAEKTKKKAIAKMEHFSLTVGSPELLREDPLLNYADDDAWGNVVKMALWRHNQAVKLVGKHVIDIPVVDWSQNPPKFIGTQAYVVNAAYTPTENGIYIPLGYIQKPFVDLDERGMEYNLSRIGFTIAHEMSHALDDLGSNYDEYGRLRNWWTEHDKREFKKIQRNVIKQYEAFASYDGITFDAEPSIGEDLADISGFAICQEYLRDFQMKNQYILPIQSLSFETFFVCFAVQSRQKISKKAVLAQLKTNPHPLDKYRCNVPLSRSRVFRAIYNVKKGDKMWWPNIDIHF